MQTRIVTWMDGEDLPWKLINSYMAEIFNGKNAPTIREVSHTGNEAYAAVVADELISREQAQEAWDVFMAEIERTGDRKAMDDAEAFRSWHAVIMEGIGNIPLEDDLAAMAGHQGFESGLTSEQVIASIKDAMK